MLWRCFSAVYHLKSNIDRVGWTAIIPTPEAFSFGASGLANILCLQG